MHAREKWTEKLPDNGSPGRRVSPEPIRVRRRREARWSDRLLGKVLPPFSVFGDR